MDENIKLKEDLQKIARQVEKKEDEAAFATPNGSVEHEPVTSAPTMWDDDEKENTKEPKPEGENSGKGKGSKKRKEKTQGDTQEQTLNVILKLVEGMQELHKKVMKNGEHESNEAEVVRGAVELSRSQDWNAETSPIDMPTGCYSASHYG